MADEAIKDESEFNVFIWDELGVQPLSTDVEGMSQLLKDLLGD